MGALVAHAGGRGGGRGQRRGGDSLEPPRVDATSPPSLEAGAHRGRGPGGTTDEPASPGIPARTVDSVCRCVVSATVDSKLRRGHPETVDPRSGEVSSLAYVDSSVATLRTSPATREARGPQTATATPEDGRRSSTARQTSLPACGLYHCRWLTSETGSPSDAVHAASPH